MNRAAKVGSFWLYMAVSLLIVLVALVTLFEVERGSHFDPNAEMIEYVDIVNNHNIIKSYFIRDLVEREVEDLEQETIDHIIAEQQKGLNEVSQANLMTCVESERYVIYNGLDLRSIDNTEVNCIPQSFITTVKSSLISNLKENIEGQIKEVPLYSQEELEVLVVEDPETLDTINIEILGSNEKRFGIKKVKIEETYHVGSYDYVNYFETLEILEILFEELSKLIEAKSCAESSTTCIETLIVEILERENRISFLERVDIEVERVKAVDDAILFRFNFRDSQTQEILSEFFFILKDNFLPGALNFNLDIVNSAEDPTVALTLVDGDGEPLEQTDIGTEKIKHFLVAYSYEDFFDESKDYNEELMELLEEGFDEDNLVKTGCTSCTDVYYRLDDKSLGRESGVSFLLIPEPRVDSLDLYQIYNYDKEEYELLTQGKSLFTYIFVVSKDNKLNLVSEDLNTQSLELTNAYHPIPVGLDNHAQSGQITVETISQPPQSILFTITDYLDPSFDKFEIYLAPEGGADLSKLSNDAPGCEGVDGECYKVNTNSQLDRESLWDEGISTQILISSNTIEHAVSGAISLEFSLVENTKYNFVVIPIDKENKGVFESYSAFTYNQEGGDEKVFQKSTSSQPRRLVVSSAFVKAKE